MKEYFLVILLSICFFISSASAAKETIDVIAIDYPPFTSKNSPDYGISFSLLSKYAKEHMQVSVLPYFLPPARAQHTITKGDWCLSFYPPSTGNELSRFIPLSDDMIQLGLYRIKASSAFTWEQLSELKGKSVALLRANTRGKMHQRFIDAGLNIVYVESVEQGIMLMLKYRVDFSFGDVSALERSTLSLIDRRKIQFSDSYISKTHIGFFYNTRCKERLFLQPQQFF